MAVDPGSQSTQVVSPDCGASGKRCVRERPSGASLGNPAKHHSSPRRDTRHPSQKDAQRSRYVNWGSPTPHGPPWGPPTASGNMRSLWEPHSSPLPSTGLKSGWKYPGADVPGAALRLMGDGSW